MPAKLHDVLQSRNYRAVLRFAALAQERGRPVSPPDIGRKFGTRASTVHSQLARMADQGYVRLEGESRNRRVFVTEEGLKRGGIEARLKTNPLRVDDSLQFAQLPIGCGELKAAIEEPDWVSHPFADVRDGDYLLEAEGDSMLDPHTGQGIKPGSKLHMRPDLTIQNGQVVHAEYVEDDAHECTLKVFHLDEASGEVRLWALNPAYPDIVRSINEIWIRGVVLDVTAPPGRFTRK